MEFVVLIIFILLIIWAIRYWYITLALALIGLVIYWIDEEKQEEKRRQAEEEKVDPATFQILNADYTKDKNNVWFNGVMLSRDTQVQIDTSTFQLLGCNYAKDKNNVWLKDVILSKADPITFQILKHSFAKDKNKVWQFDRIIHGVDSATFQLLDYGHPSDGYAKDKNNVWHTFSTTDYDIDSGGYPTKEHFVLIKADPATFQLLEDKYAKDKNNVWRYGKIINRDVA